MGDKSKLERWESYRAEMEDNKQRLAVIAKSFLELGAFEDAASCAIKAQGLEYVIGRMPKF